MGEGVRGSGDSVRVGNMRFHGVTRALVVLEAVGAKGSSLVAIDSTREVFLSVLGEVFDTEVTGEGETGGSCDTCTRRETLFECRSQRCGNGQGC
jgi:hypothetical protein